MMAEIATAVAPGCHAALLVDQAGWHLSHQLAIPPNKCWSLQRRPRVQR